MQPSRSLPADTPRLRVTERRSRQKIRSATFPNCLLRWNGRFSGGAWPRAFDPRGFSQARYLLETDARGVFLQGSNTRWGIAKRKKRNTWLRFIHSH